jgi:hypothetical protein
VRRFVFRLERLESLREMWRMQARADLAVALGEARERERERERLESAYDEAESAVLPEDMAEDPRSLKDLLAWREGRRRSACAAGRLALLAWEGARAAEGVHAEAARDHRVMEKLHERRHREWLESAEREEQKFLDEVHILRVAREQREEV